MAFQILSYQREKALSYAAAWALSRNPSYYNFDGIGGDCTNFISQCLYAGSEVMNHQPVTGWYYYSLKKRSASWTSVHYFYEFLLSNKGAGPYGHHADISETNVGDYVQLATEHDYFHHSGIIVSKTHSSDLEQIYIACHTYDAYMRPLSSYNIQKIRCIAIDGVRKYL